MDVLLPAAVLLRSPDTVELPLDVELPVGLLDGAADVTFDGPDADTLFDVVEGVGTGSART